jgi:hypothetical protein
VSADGGSPPHRWVFKQIYTKPIAAQAPRRRLVYAPPHEL